MFRNREGMYLARGVGREASSCRRSARPDVSADCFTRFGGGKQAYASGTRQEMSSGCDRSLLAVGLARPPELLALHRSLRSVAE